MRKTFWCVCLTALAAAGGCDGLLSDDAGERSGTSGQSDPGFDPGGADGCGADALDLTGCACTAGDPERACYRGASAQAGSGACSYGTQKCETTTDSEFDSSAWGECVGSVEPGKEICGDKIDNDCNGVVDDCGGGDDNPGDGKGDKNDNDPECCAQKLDTCLGFGESSSVCASLDEMCKSGTCDALTSICDPTTVPVSTMCAHLYYECFNFRVNKCSRESYDTCVAALGDAALCAAWDASCTAREDYCQDLVGGCAKDTQPCDPPADPPDGNPDLSGEYSYPCTDWGHIFDPCWATYTACGAGTPACTSALQTCLAQQGDIYAPLCPGPEDDSSGDGDKKP